MNTFKTTTEKVLYDFNRNGQAPQCRREIENFHMALLWKETEHKLMWNRGKTKEK